MTSPLDRCSPLRACLRAEADLGIALASDPVNANRPDLFLRVTTINSRWYARRCRVCQDKFREGDQVRLCPACQEPYHDDTQYTLHCWQGRFSTGGLCKCGFTWSGALPDQPAPSAGGEVVPHTPPPAAMLAQFLGGLEAVWGAFGHQKSLRVEPGSGLVGRACPWCRFRVRAGDWVVACPCSSGDKHCGTYFHQDVFRHLTCWNNWNGVAGHDHCPNTMRRYGRPARE